jgi:hypothetical protein
MVTSPVGAASDRWPTEWRVNGNGVTGTLELAIGQTGALTGRLYGEAVEGYVSGRHVVIRRTVGEEGRSEVWEGWLAQPSGEGSELIVAGTITISEGDRTQVYPWFGTRSSPAPPPVATPPVADVESVPAPPPLVPAAEPVPAQATGERLSGKWLATEGTVEIVQDGKLLTVVMPGGSSHSGRVTGGDTLIVGLRKGCCNGKLEGPDVISWGDGSRWKRAD